MRNYLTSFGFQKLQYLLPLSGPDVTVISGSIFYRNSVNSYNLLHCFLYYFSKCRHRRYSPSNISHELSLKNVNTTLQTQFYPPYTLLQEEIFDIRKQETHLYLHLHLYQYLHLFLHLYLDLVFTAALKSLDILL